MQHLITFACLLAALAAYSTGWATHAALLVACGMLFAGAFWLRLLRRRKPQTTISGTTLSPCAIEVQANGNS